jgi:hypothetical protein
MKNSKKELSPAADQKATVEDSELPENGGSPDLSHKTIPTTSESDLDRQVR